MTGGGFGGSVVALADAGEAEAFTATVTEAYVARTGLDGTGLRLRDGRRRRVAVYQRWCTCGAMRRR